MEIRGLDLPEPPPSPPLNTERVWEGIESYSAVRLFLQTARRVYLPFALSDVETPFVVRICQLVEGMPLGIELAATWVRVRSCEAIAREIERNLDFLATSLHDVPARHRSLRAVFDYSWGFLSDVERSVFKKLSVVRGGFQREAAEQIANASPAILSSLVSKSFLRQNASERYDLHELLRQYTVEKLKETPEEYEKTRDIHCAYYAEFLQQREIRKGGKQREMLAEIVAEIDNVWAGWHWAVEQRKWTKIGNFTEGLFSFYELRGRFQEGESTLRRAVMELIGGRRSIDDYERNIELNQEESQVLGQILSRQAWFCFRLGLYRKARELLQQGLAMLRPVEHGTRQEIGFSLYQLGIVAWYMGEYREAQQFLQESLVISQEIEDQFVIASSLMHLGLTAHALGEYARAELLHQQGLEIYQAINEKRGVALGLISLGSIAYTLGEYTKAEKLLQGSLAICQELGDPFGTALTLRHLGVLAYLVREYIEAKQLLQESLKIFEEIGERWGIALSLTSLGYATCRLEEYQEAKNYLLHALEISRETQLIPVALAALVGIATLLLKEGKNKRALELLTLILHHPASEKETQDKAERLLVELKPQFPSQVVATTLEKGQARKLEEVVAEVLGKI